MQYLFIEYHIYLYKVSTFSKTLYLHVMVYRLCRY